MAQGSSNPTTDLKKIAGTEVVSGGTNGTLAIGGIQAHDAAASGNKPVLIGGVANTSSPPAVSSGDVSQLWVTANGALNVADGGSSLSIDDAGGSLTVDGTVAATQSGTWNVGTVTTVTGVTTVTSLTQLNGQAIAMGTGVRTAGTQRVTIATDDAVNIGSIGGAITPGTGANNLGKPVDGAAGATDVGVLALAVRDDALATLTPADNDYTQLRVTSQGRLWTSAVVDTALPAGTNNIGDVDVASLPGTVASDITAIKTAVETLDNAVSGNELQVDIVASLPAGTNSIGNVNTISAVTTVSTVTNLSQLGGNAIAMGSGVRTAGTQRVTIATDDVVPISDNSGSLTVDAPVGTPVFVRLSDGSSAITTLPVSLASLPSLAAGTNSIGNVNTVSAVTTVSTVTNLSQLGGTAISMGTGTRDAGTQRVTIATNDSVPVTGTFWQATQPVSLALAKAEDAASADADSLLPIAAVRQDTIAASTSADGDYTWLKTNNVGRLYASAAIDTALPAGTNNIGDVDVASLPGTVATDITAIKTAVETLDNAVSGNELQVDIVASLPAGTNSIGNVNTVSAVTTVSTVTNLSQLGGTAISMGTGTRDAGTQRVTIATNDVVPVSDNSGSLTVDAPVGTPVFVRLSDGTSAITNLATNLAQVGGTTTVTGGTNGTLAIGGIQAHDAVASGNKPVLIGAVANSSAPPAVASGDVSQLWTTTTGALNVADGGSSLSIDDSGGSLTVDAPVGTPVFVRLSDGSAAITNLATNLAQVGGTTTVTGGTNGTLAIGGVQAHDAAASGNKPVLIGGVANTSSPPAVSSGDVSQLWTTTTGALNVADSGGSLTVDAPVGTPVFVRLSDGSSAITNLATNLAQVGGTTTVTGGTAGSQGIGGIQAHDAAVSGNNPVLTGGVANNSVPTAVAAGDVSRHWTNLNGAMATAAYPENISAFAPTNATSTALASSLVVKASAGTLYMITGYSARASAQFIHVYNAASLPSDGGVPVMVFTVPAQSNFSLDLGRYGRHFTTGIVIGNSTTAATKTIGSADCWFDVQYK